LRVSGFLEKETGAKIGNDSTGRIATELYMDEFLAALPGK